MLSMRNLLNHITWRLPLFSCWLCCRIPFVTHENFLFEVESEIVMWRHECKQTTIRQKKGNLLMYLAVISLFFWEIQMLFFFFLLSLSLFLSSSLYGRKERKVGLKCRLVLTHIWLCNERQVSAMCWATTYIRSSLATFSHIFSLEANGWKTAEPQVSESDGNLGM